MKPAEFTQLVLKKTAKPESFRPTAYYDADGDCIEFIAKPDGYFGERIDKLVTVYYSQHSKKIVGCLIKGISKLMRENVGVKIVVQEGKVKIECLIAAYAGRLETHSANERVYRDLYRVAEKADVEAEVEACRA